MENNSSVKVTNEIDIIAVLQKTLRRTKLLGMFLGVFAVLGVIVALLTQKKYTSSAVLAPEVLDKSSLTSSIADMASSFGFDLGSLNSNDAISPEIYPDVLASKQFILNLFDVPVRTLTDDTVKSYKEHLQTESWSLKSMIMSMFAVDDEVVEQNKYVISKADDELSEAISKNIVCEVDKKTSLITIAVEDKDPLVAAILCDTVTNRLQYYIKDYRTRKNQLDLEYYTELYGQAEVQYEQDRRCFIAFADANVLASKKSVLVEQEALERKMQRSFAAMIQFDNQIVAARAKIQENTPVFIVVDSPMMANKASSLPRKFIVLAIMFLGGVLCAVWVNWGEELFARWKKQRNV